MCISSVIKISLKFIDFSVISTLKCFQFAMLSINIFPASNIETLFMSHGAISLIDLPYFHLSSLSAPAMWKNIIRGNVLSLKIYSFHSNFHDTPITFVRFFHICQNTPKKARTLLLASIRASETRKLHKYHKILTKRDDNNAM